MEQCDRRSGRLGEVLCQRKCADGAVLDLRPFMGENQPGRIFFDIERAVQTVPIFRCCGRPRNGNVWSGDLPGTEDMYATVPVLCIKACDQITSCLRNGEPPEPRSFSFPRSLPAGERRIPAPTRASGPGCGIPENRCRRRSMGPHPLCRTDSTAWRRGLQRRMGHGF